MYFSLIIKTDRKNWARPIYAMIATILEINYVHFLQFQMDFILQAILEESFIYIIHKPIDLSVYF